MYSNTVTSFRSAINSNTVPSDHREEPRWVVEREEGRGGWGFPGQLCGGDRDSSLQGGQEETGPAVWEEVARQQDIRRSVGGEGFPVWWRFFRGEKFSNSVEILLGKHATSHCIIPYTFGHPQKKNFSDFHITDVPLITKCFSLKSSTDYCMFGGGFSF